MRACDHIEEICEHPCIYCRSDIMGKDEPPICDFPYAHCLIDMEVNNAWLKQQKEANKKRQEKD